MALELKLEYTINDTVTQIVVTDKTGVYDVNNLGGWGSPNTERADIALILYAKYNPYEKTPLNLSIQNAVSPVVLYDNSYLNSEISTYSLTYHADGWYQFYLAVANTTPTNLENNIYYSTVLSKLQIYKTSAYVDLTSADWNYLSDDAYHTVVLLEDILMPKLVVQRNCQLEKYITCMDCTACKCEQIKEEYVRLNALIQGSDYRFHSDKQAEAQRMVEKLTKQYNCCK